MTTWIARVRRLAPHLMLGIAIAVAAAPAATGATTDAAGGTGLVDSTLSAAQLHPPLAATAPVTPPGVSRTGWQWPVTPPHVLRPFAPPPVRWASGHRGVDLGAASGVTVRAPAPGVVTYAGVLAGRSVLVVTHANGLRSTFEPVIADVAVGTRVAGGEPVGKVANLVLSAGSHCAAWGCVHWGVLRGETYLDPLAMLRGPAVLLPL